MKDEHRLNKKFPNLKRNIFIVTYGRSGSTLLQSLLSTIPDSDIRGENFNTLGSIWSATLRSRKAKRMWGKVRQQKNHPWYGADEVKPLLFARGMVDSFIDNILNPPKDCRYFGFKEIRYNALNENLPEFLDFMRFHFKDPFFVFNMRSVESVAKSAWWKNWKEDDVVRLVHGMDRRMSDYHAAHPDHTALLKYEDYSNNPEALRPLFDQLNEPFDAPSLLAVLETRLKH